MPTLQRDGYEIHRAVFSQHELARVRDEAERVGSVAGSACVRHLRTRSPLFAELAVDLRLLRLVPNGLVAVRSILFDKRAGWNWPVPWHQDLTIAVDRKAVLPGYGPWSVKDGVDHVEPPLAVLAAMAALRIHLDDTGSENGALQVCPGTHRLGRLAPGRARHKAGTCQVTCECLAGDVLVMSPLILHSSRRSSTPHRRRIVHFEYAPMDCLDPRLGWYEVQERRRPGVTSP